MTTNKRHIKVDVSDDDYDFAAAVDEEATLPDPPEISEDDVPQQEQRGYRR